MLHGVHGHCHVTFANTGGTIPLSQQFFREFYVKFRLTSL